MSLLDRTRARTGLDPFGLASRGEATAVVLPGRRISYADLHAMVRERAERLGPVRRLVLLECANALDPLVTYLAALDGGHPVLLLPERSGTAAEQQWSRVRECYRPDVVVRAETGWALEEATAGPAPDLHPDLAVLLGTSGSTGTPKLVRLSRDNLTSNAAAIASYLGLGPEDRAATTLPAQYCYGLSVINSHLASGGSLWLTGASVVDAGFWDDFEQAGATSFAGVPYTFDLLARAGIDWPAQPGLRHATQAGGRLAPELVSDLALRTREHDVDFVVMYGQTEATARMAYLPAHLAAERPECIGVPIDGGEFRIDTSSGTGAGDGELVYTGPNVMMGYALEPADLGRGPELTELRTGDLAVQHDDGLYQIVGRRNRLAKPYGVRLDLDLVERLLAEAGIPARVLAQGDLVRVFVRDGSEASRAREQVTGTHCLPAHAVSVETVPAFPQTPAGKPDYATLERTPLSGPATTPDESAADTFAAVFGRPIRPGDSFVSLGGDSLSYVEVALRLERLLGTVPSTWPQLTVAELDAVRRRPRRWTARVETPVILRALAILLIVGSHTEFYDLMGGAHVLLGLVGFNLVRFALAAPTRRRRLAALATSARDILVPAGVWIGAVALIDGRYDWPTALMLNDLVGSDRWNDNWQFWFLEVVLWGTVAVLALLSLPGVDRWYRRHPFGFALGLTTATLALRVALTGAQASKMELYQLPTAAWCLALGWLVATARTRSQRLLASVLILASVLGYFGNTERELVVVGGLLLLVWVPAITVPRVLVRPLGAVGAASFFIYLTHWVVYPPLDADHDFLAAAASVAVGLVAWQVYARARLAFGQAWRQVRGGWDAGQPICGTVRSRASA